MKVNGVEIDREELLESLLTVAIAKLVDAGQLKDNVLSTSDYSMKMFRGKSKLMVMTNLIPEDHVVNEKYESALGGKSGPPPGGRAWGVGIIGRDKTLPGSWTEL